MKPYGIILAGIILVGLLITVGGRAAQLAEEVSSLSYVSETASSTEIVNAVVEIDNLSKAQEMLDGANQILDQEEQLLLDKRKEIDLRLEQIRETRSSF